MTESRKRPLPARVWWVFGGMVLLACVCFVLAVLMGGRLRDLGPERNGNREGYGQVLREPVGDETAQVRFDAWMAGASVTTVAPVAEVSVTEGGGVGVSGSGAVRDTGYADVPMELPLLPPEALVPTELPPVDHAKPEVFAPRDVSPLAVVPMPENPVWKANAVSVAVSPGAPMLALLIDDMGGDMDNSRRAVAELPAGVTLSFFPWSRPGIGLAHAAHGEGHEIMIHMPMEALPHASGVPDPGPDTLRVGMQPDVVESLLSRNVARLADVAVGVNNHMGSRFTGWEEGMRAVLTVLQREGMLFVDSKTSAPTATQAAAKGLMLPVVTRDVFLDHVSTPEAVRAELKKAVLLARKRGQALAIGHPLPITLDVLREELPRVVSSGVVLVPVSMLVKTAP